jgi:hypothetical protein
LTSATLRKERVDLVQPTLRSDLPEFGPGSDGEWGLGQMPRDPTSLVSEKGIQYEGNTEYIGNLLLHELYDLHYSMLLPGHATIHINGKNEIERLMADRAMQLGDSFNMREFMDRFLASGMIPLSLTRWEMTGFDDKILKLK